MTSDYRAQYGRSGSTTVEAVINSSTRGLHGADEFVRNDAFNARHFFSPNVPSYKKIDFGYAGGVPVHIPRLYLKRIKVIFLESGVA